VFGARLEYELAFVPAVLDPSARDARAVEKSDLGL